MIVSDLAANPSIDCQWFLPDTLHRRVTDFLPGYRFIAASEVLKDVKPLRLDEIALTDFGDREAEYKRFAGDICAKLGWEPPWIQTERWVKAYPSWPTFFPVYQFLAGCQLRLDRPLLFPLPSDYIDAQGTWNHHIKGLPFPPFVSVSGRLRFYFSDHHKHPSAIGQEYALVALAIFDDLIFRDGPVNWSKFSGWRLPAETVKELLGRHLHLHGVDLDNVICD